MSVDRPQNHLASTRDSKSYFKLIMNKTSEKIYSITVIGRRWFRRRYGGTYHTAQIMVKW